MILNCPSCSAKFMVSADAVGDQGRTVRCGKCGHNWFQAPAHDSLDDLQKLVDNIQQEENGAENARLASAEAAVAGAVESSGAEIKLERSPRELAKDTKTKTAKINLFFVPYFQKHEREIAAFMTALACVSVLVWIIVSVAHMMLKPTESQLTLDQIQFEMTAEKLDGSFRVINMSGDEQDIPQFKVFLSAENGRILSSQTVTAEADTIKGEDSVAIPFSFRAPPSIATSIKVLSVE